MKTAGNILNNMGKAYQCDRCGEYSSDSPSARIEEYRGGHGKKPTIAKLNEEYLCPSCHDDYKDFINEEL